MILPIGPIHPGLKEPLRLKLKTQGEKVIKAEIDYGYVHRGIEKIMEGKTWQKAIYLSERICGICSYEHTQTFAESLELMQGIEVPLRAQLLRVITNELDRIQSHYLANSTFFKTLDHETLFMHVLDLREYAMDAIELLTGNRVNMGWNVVGGVRMDADDSHFSKILDKLAYIDKNHQRTVELFKGPILSLRTKEVGLMTKQEALQGGAVGPIGRASGLKHDYRQDHYAYKKHLDFEPIWRDEGDNFARTMNRFDEIPQSVDLIKQAIELMPKGGDIRVPIEVKTGSNTVKNEAPRGEVTYMVQTNGHLIKEISIRTPSIMNIDSCAKYMLQDVATIADAVSTYASCDPCIACAERVGITDVSSGKTTTKDFYEIT